MENHLKSILPFLPPLKLHPSGCLAWPNPDIIDILTIISKGPSRSRVNSGESLFNAISRIRTSLFLSSEHHLATSTSKGLAHFFDQLLRKEESLKWYNQLLPAMADLALRLPSLLEWHYKDYCHNTPLQLLHPQQPGFVLLDQRLIAALLSCSLFCMFPTAIRKAKHMSAMNMDKIFGSIHDSYHENQRNKIQCIVHYFERICSSTVIYNVSFERKVYYDVPLCNSEVLRKHKVKRPHSPAAFLEVLCTNRYIGGRVLMEGCSQEEIHFMTHPEMIAGMIFLPALSNNEAIEIVGAEKFSNHKGYDATFRYVGDCEDRSVIFTMGRRRSGALIVLKY